MSDGENVIGGGDPAELLERHRKVLPSWVLLYYDQPMELVRGGDPRLGRRGREYLDFFGGIVTRSLGT
jgi:4-aminobutyrate aminotransferase